MVKKVKNGGVYWLDFHEIKKPEWGNSPDGNPHLYILLKHHKEEMYLAFPLSTNAYFLELYGDKIVQVININNESHYMLLNHVRTISKARISGIYKDNNTWKVLIISEFDLERIKNAYKEYIILIFNNAIKSKFEIEIGNKKNEEEILEKIDDRNYNNSFLKKELPFLGFDTLWQLFLENGGENLKENTRKKELINTVYELLKIEE